jgi:hypothetical protein
MATQPGTMALLARRLGDALAVLETRSIAEVTEPIGLRLPEAITTDPQVATAAGAVSNLAASLRPMLQSLSDAIVAGNEAQIGLATARLVAKIGEATAALRTLGTTLETRAATVSGLTAAERAQLQAFAHDLPRRSMEFLLIDWLEARVPALVSILTLLGIVEIDDVTGGGAEPLSTPHTRRRLYLERLPDLARSPAVHFENVYGWGRTDFDPARLFAVIKRLFDSFDMLAENFTLGGEPALEVFLFKLQRNRSLSPPGLDLELRVPATEDVTENLLDQPPWSLDLAVGGRFAAGGTATIRPPAAVAFSVPNATAGLELALRLVAQDSTSPLILLGRPDASRIAARRIAAEVGTNLSFEAATGSMAGEPLVALRVEGGEVAIDLSEGDGFIRRALSGVRAAGSFELDGRWQPSTGLELEASGGIEIALPTHINLGPAELRTIYLIGRLADEVPFTFEVSAEIAVELGPLTAVIDRIGALARFDFPDNRDGNLGPLDLSFAFKPPTGVGLSIDGGGFRGGGFLSFEPALGRYVGALELDFQDELTLNALGLLTTRMPDGSDGFSLLIVISSEFTPIQLGLGFTLNGVGGLLGLNRTTKVDVLSAGIKTNALASVLFPKNIIANAPRLISDLGQIFPPQAGRFVFGPMAKIGWGTPRLISIDLGLVVEVPHPLRVVILGVLRALLPDDQRALIRIQVNFFGQWELERERLSFDASLYDSRVLSMPLTGDMSLRLAYGDNPVLLVSVGGFHPAFTPPPMGLPALERITLNLVSGDNPRITAAGYFAITSNTVQFGAKVEILAKAWKFNVYGFLGFDALFQFSPFAFAVAISGSVAVRSGSSVLFSIGLDLELSGPAPWSVNGTGSFRILFCKVKVRFSKTWGQERDTTLPDVAVLPKLLAALRQPENWEARLPARNHLLVSLRTIDDVGQDRLVIHPAGVVTVAQKVVPLDTRIQRFGNQRPADARRFTILHASANGSGFRKTPVEEYFAPAQFEDMDNAQKLSRRSFERLPAGVSLTSQDNDLRSSRVVARELRYETITIDTQARRTAQGKVTGELLTTFRPLLRGGAIAKSRFSTTTRAEPLLGPGRIGVDPEGYSVVGTDDLRPFDGQSTYRSQAGATSYLRELVRTNPALQGTLQVVPNVEVREAA